MNTLYISDLDGTLLGDDQRISDESVRILNGLIGRGVPFSVATARSYESARALLEGLDLRLPAIFMNGVFMTDAKKGETLDSRYLANELGQAIAALYLEMGLNPVVYTTDQEGKSRVYYRGIFNASESAYFEDRLRKERDRFRLVDDYAACLTERVIAVNAIETPERLEAAYAALKERAGCVCHYGPDIYAPAYHWLEVSSDLATKRHGALRLKERYGYERFVCFGDNLNDLSMFEAADECYAVANAHEAVKRLATGVIGSNAENGVARFMESRFQGLGGE